MPQQSKTSERRRSVRLDSQLKRTRMYKILNAAISCRHCCIITRHIF
jgi:hypothetical protein